MNSVVPCRRLSAFSPAVSCRVQLQPDDVAPHGPAAAGRGRSVGSSSSSGAPASVSLQYVRLLAPAPRPSATRRCHAA